MEMKEALETLNTIDKRLTEVQEDNKASCSAIEKKVAELGEQQVLVSKQILELQQKAECSADSATRSLSMGERFVKSDSYKSFLGNHRSASIIIEKEEAEPIKVGTLVPPYRAPGIVDLEQRVLKIEGLFPHIPVAENSIEYLKEKTFTNGAKAVAEAALKPSTKLDFETKQTNVQVIAHWTKITRQLADDAPALAAFINARMIYGVNLAVENQLVTGDGTAPNLSGIMKDGNFTAQNFALSDIGGAGATLLDLLRVSIAKVNNEGYNANAILLNPMDWAVLQGMKETGGKYLFGIPSTSFEGTSVWGVRVIPTAAMEKGKYLVGDFTRAATIYDRMQTVIDVAAQNEDDFIKNLYTIRAERRLALAVERPLAMVGGSLVVPAS